MNISMIEMTFYHSDGEPITYKFKDNKEYEDFIENYKPAKARAIKQNPTLGLVNDSIADTLKETKAEKKEVENSKKKEDEAKKRISDAKAKRDAAYKTYTNSLSKYRDDYYAYRNAADKYEEALSETNTSRYDLDNLLDLFF